MASSGSDRRTSHAVRGAAALFGLLVLCACAQPSAGDRETGALVPAVDPTREAVSGLEVGHRLMAAGEYDLALDAYTRAALDQGLTPEVLINLGSANLALGRLGQAERQLRRAAEAEPDRPEAWNNLGVVLMEQGEVAQAAQLFRKAFDLDNGQSLAIRDNLRFALAKMENSDSIDPQQYKLVRRSGGEYLIRQSEP